MQNISMFPLRTTSANAVQGSTPLSHSAVLWYQLNMSGHAQRVALFARALASRLALSAPEVRLIGLAALLHDIGKAAIPTTILTKPGPLTTQEWSIMRRHAEIGYQMLMCAGESWTRIAPLVLQHHERWDGQGYPNGIAGEEILFGARIIAVADSYDAMTEPRAYRQPSTMEQARAELQRGAGSQYDPTMVAAMLQVLDNEGLHLNHTRHPAQHLLHGGVTVATRNILTLVRTLSPRRTYTLAAVHIP